MASNRGTLQSDVDDALKVWRESLVNLSKRNRALNFKHTKRGSFSIDSPSMIDVFEGLRAGWTWAFQGEPDEADSARPPRPLGKRTLHSGRRMTDLTATIRNLQRRATQEYLDRGLSVLYIGLGEVRWIDEDHYDYGSPLLLVPVTFQRARSKELPRLTTGDDDIVVNPALVLRLAQFGVELPTIDDIEFVDLESFMAAVARRVRSKQGWTVHPGVILSVFSFQKEAMYRDLLDHERQIALHPVVQALATQDPTAQDGSLLFDEVDADQIDDVAPPEEVPLVLDADSSQRVCIAAAVHGHSFVMDGPPGTGKSQTIANIIGALIHSGRKVLFVSEKAAALEVVRNRLTEVGLGSYVLELHSHKASRKEVAAQLKEGLETVARPPTAMGASLRSQAATNRVELTDYALAVNTVREPLGRSLHDVLGRLSQLFDVPAAPTPSMSPRNLTRENLVEVEQAADQISHAWRPAAQGSSFVWRDVTERSSMVYRIEQAERDLQELVRVRDHNAALVDAFDAKPLRRLPLLVSLIELSVRRPAGARDVWLIEPRLDEIEQSAADLRRLTAELGGAAEVAANQAGVNWRSVPIEDELVPQVDLGGLEAPVANVSRVGAQTARATAGRFDSDAEVLVSILADVAKVSDLLGLPRADGPVQVDVVLEIAELGFAPHRPDDAWLTSIEPGQVRHAARALHLRLDGLAKAEREGRRVFTDAALGQPLEELHQRFTTVHHGFHKLSREYRDDKKAVAAFTQQMVRLEDAIKALGLAIDWSGAVAQFGEAESALAPALGSYWCRWQTDFAAVEAAVVVAERVRQLCPPESLRAVSAYLASPPRDPALRQVIERIRSRLKDWRARLGAEDAIPQDPSLSMLTFESSISWLRRHAEALRVVADRADAVSSVTGMQVTGDDIDSILQACRDVRLVEDRIAERATRDGAVLGELYRGSDTDFDALDDALRWARQVRGVDGREDQGLTSVQANSFAALRQTEHLGKTYGRWAASIARVLAAFGDGRRQELEAECDLVDDAESFLTTLAEDTGGQAEWFSYSEAKAALERRGCGSIVAFCVERGLTPDEIAPVCEKALLGSWADSVMSSDKRLARRRARDHDDLVTRFQRLDHQLIMTSTSEIITEANKARPARVDIGTPALIKREGAKKARHMPVRELISRTVDTTLAIKPCFMMSPLAVSQYLPADIKFDTVIFDEASQVTPSDAINCVYRGEALITAGDDKQLPPTTFFDRMTDEEDAETDVVDFQSVLELAKASGGFRNLGLKWHYRSRHEDLIAFSNTQFYSGKLITFPSALAEGPDVGVALIHASGVYRRGTTRDNPIEAAKVIERVLHHFETRPGKSVGVVTFSVAQAEAIQVALDRLIDDRPDLADQLDGDRLHGFFIKSLESVQGDERDVMIFSVGYGPDEFGRTSTNFGALNKPKGWRRLNVAITRARERVEIVSSMRAGDIAASDNENVRHLVAYLDYAERGIRALGLDAGPTGHDPDNPFEESVLEAVRSMGYVTEAQVGAAGYRIDIGVRHPDLPGSFALGIECDGASYHSSRTARDRDRLRAEVLTGLGWRLHRIWSTAWFSNRDLEISRLRSALTVAVEQPVAGRLSLPGRPASRPVVSSVSVEDLGVPEWVHPYKRAVVPRLPHWLDPSDPSARWEMIKSIQTIAKDEGPVHIKVVHRRLRQAWNIGRIGHRIRENIASAIQEADVNFDDTFLDAVERGEVMVRCPGADGELRTVGQVHADELASAMVHLVDDTGSISRDELCVATARIFEWNRVGSEIVELLSGALDRLIAEGKLDCVAGNVRRKPRS